MGYLVPTNRRTVINNVGYPTFSLDWKRRGDIAEYAKVSWTETVLPDWLFPYYKRFETLLIACVILLVNSVVEGYIKEGGEKFYDREHPSQQMQPEIIVTPNQVSDYNPFTKPITVQLKAE